MTGVGAELKFPYCPLGENDVCNGHEGSLEVPCTHAVLEQESVMAAPCHKFIHPTVLTRNEEK